MTRSGAVARYLPAGLPTMIRFGSGMATTDGTRLRPSSPGMTTGWSPCMNATSELVVPKSIPTMRASAMRFPAAGGRDSLLMGCSAFDRLVDVADEVAYVTAAVEKLYHLIF